MKYWTEWKYQNVRKNHSMVGCTCGWRRARIPLSSHTHTHNLHNDCSLKYYQLCWCWRRRAHPIWSPHLCKEYTPMFNKCKVIYIYFWKCSTKLKIKSNVFRIIMWNLFAFAKNIFFTKNVFVSRVSLILIM